ncbi:phage major capsid protein, P2 family [Microbulbifer thermotolerans]|uniref:phage major capsid protein, P2 family n=1 Tax=Microbulbifer thermotolerans TaxID=252514 RepID=UPI00224AB9EF|nr:phage major capsid protein, P2 family [Microbulbifer thermotolerans]MCX2834467.1 phage major capsid protein, P2 family [Microbulbifer thermotolerans]
MQPKTKKLFGAMLAAMASTYGVASVSEAFSVEPTIAQELQDKIVESDAFLREINVVPVDEIKGEKVIGSAAGLVPKRTNTDANDRQTSDVLSLGSKLYELFHTEFDTHIKWSTIDAWAKFPDFQERYGKWVRKAIALARIRVGWVGTSAAAVTDPEANPNGEDVNKGWLQLLREYKEGAQWFDGTTGTQEAGEIRIGKGGDFENLDATVHAVKQMINPLHRGAKDLVAIVGEELVAEEKAALYKAMGQTPTEKERIEKEVVSKVYAGLPLKTDVPFFPARGILITSLDNLSIYYQTDSWRRQVQDNPKRCRVEDYNSVNEGYVIEDEEKAAGVEFAKVKLPDGNGGWA